MVESGGQQVGHVAVLRSATDVEQVTTAVDTDTLGMSPGYSVWNNGEAAAPVLDQDLVILLGVLSDSGRTHGNVTGTWRGNKK